MRVLAIEYQLGSQQETGNELRKDNQEWDVDAIAAKTGVLVRHVAQEGESPLTMAISAAQRLLSTRDRELIDAVIYVTQSPDSMIPATACLFHEALSLPKTAMAFDVNQGCTGFVYGLSLSSALLSSGQRRQVLLVCADAYQKHIDKHDRTCRPIFSDGATATLLEDDGQHNVGPFVFLTDGSGAKNLELRGTRLFMDGPRVLMFTMSAVPKAVRQLLEQANLSLGDIDLFFFHQASAIVLNNIQRTLMIPDTKFIRELDDVGNTVASTIPIALKRAHGRGVLQTGQTVLLMGFGVGYSLAGCILRT